MIIAKIVGLLTTRFMGCVWNKLHCVSISRIQRTRLHLRNLYSILQRFVLEYTTFTENITYFTPLYK